MKTSTALVLMLLVTVCFWGGVAEGQYIHYPSAPSGETIAPPSGISSSVAPSLPPDPSPVIGGSVPGPDPGYGGVVQAPPGGWDPYAPPGAGQAPTLLPQDYYPQVPAFASQDRLQRLIDEIRLDYHYLSPRGSKSFGTNDLDLSLTMAFPFLYNAERPLLVTPGFAFHWWQGPTGEDLSPTSFLAYMPPRVYDAYLGAAWNPKVSEVVSGELGFRVGVYSDFTRVTSRSVRYTGHGILVLSLSPSFKLKGGIVYYDRVRIKMLPEAGIVWTPTPDVMFDISVPAPKVSWRLSNYGNTEWWLYCRGEYGGGSWTVAPDNMVAPPVDLDQVDYNDLRASLGFEFNRLDQIRGLFEVGVSFDRELVTRTTDEKYSPSTTVFLRGGLIR